MAHRQDPFQCLDEFADVAGPVVSRQAFEKFGGKPLDARPMALADPGRVMESRFPDIFDMLSQGRQFDVDRAEAEEEIVPELAAAGHLIQVAVGRGNEPEVALPFDLLPTGRKTLS